VLFALGDVHLSHAVKKPMDIFGSVWEDHDERIRENWMRKVSPDDTVLLPGDLSWAMTLAEAKADLEWLGNLPGRQILLRGNHDYWWSGIGRVRNQLTGNQTAIQNDAVSVEGYAVCGSRGWLLPSHPQFSDSDAVIYSRELQRLTLSLDAGARMGLPLLVMLHYPPLSQTDTDTEFTRMLEAYGVRLCIYGHLHGAAHRFAVQGTHNGVNYQLVSADYLNFEPLTLSPAPCG